MHLGEEGSDFMYMIYGIPDNVVISSVSFPFFLPFFPTIPSTAGLYVSTSLDRETCSKASFEKKSVLLGYKGHVFECRLHSGYGWQDVKVRHIEKTLLKCVL